ncbi:hypothetical protein AB5N19_09135 [Seiridium cardinale]
MDTVPDLAALPPLERRSKLAELLHENENLTKYLNMGSKIFSDVLNIIMPLDKPLDALVITVMPIEEWHQHPMTSWLTFRCAHSGKSWLWNVRDLDDDMITHLLQVPRIGELIVHVLPADPFEKCHIVKLWTKVRDVSWILSKLRKISKLDIQFHAEFLEGEGERAFLSSSTFTLSIAGAGLRSSYNFCSLVAMALVLPLLETRAFEALQVDIPYSRTISFKGKHDIFTTFVSSPWVEALSDLWDGCETFDISRPSKTPQHTPLPPDSESESKGILSSKNNLYTPSEIKAIIGEIDHMNQYVDVAVDEVQGFEGDMLRLRRMRLYMTSARNCLSAQSRQQLNQHALVLRDTELEMLLSPSAGLTDAF